jgi:hypothetical protein
VSKDKYGYVSVDLQVFGYKNELFVFADDVEQVFYVPDVAKKNWLVVMPQLLGTNTTPYLRSDHSEKSINRNQGRKSKPDFC